MTTRNFGKVSPLQMAMLMTAGYYLTRERGSSELLLSTDPNITMHSMYDGVSLLVKMTKMNFGYSLKQWHDFLLSSNIFSKQYRSPHSWPSVERAILTELSNPNRLALEEAAQRNFNGQIK